MDFLDLVRARRSVRRYLNDPVPRDLVDRCLEAARLAPSACHGQPWRFHVADDPATRARLCDAALHSIYRMNEFCRAAPVLVAVEALPAPVAASLGGLWQGADFPHIDCAIAAEHFVLAAAAAGLGTCWIGWFDKRGAARALGLPRRARLEFLIPLGRPAHPPGAKERKPLGEIRIFHGPAPIPTRETPPG